MVDIARNAEVQRSIVRSWSTGKFATAVCHGPCSLLGVDVGDGAPFVRGKKLTAFSKKEEYDYAREDVPYELEDALRAEGAEYSSAENWQPKVVVDGRLMTGQNPASAGPLGKELLGCSRNSAEVRPLPRSGDLRTRSFRHQGGGSRGIPRLPLPAKRRGGRATPADYRVPMHFQDRDLAAGVLQKDVGGAGAGFNRVPAQPWIVASANGRFTSRSAARDIAQSAMSASCR